ncbi:MAG: zf-HC2 domain-containing protein, partial [Adhaeribacter sp.]
MKRNNSPIASGQNHLSLDLLRRYQQGALPGPEEHRVERHLLDCDLCSDVLAGMEIQNAGQTTAAVQQINRRVAAAGQRSGARVIPLFSRRNLVAAAALLLLLCSGALVLLYNLQQAQQQQQQAPLAGVQSGQQTPDGPAVLQPAPGSVADAGPEAAPAAPAPPVGPVASAASPTQVTANPSKSGRRPKDPPALQEGEVAMLADRKVESLPAAKSDAEQVAEPVQDIPPAIAAAPASAPPAEGPAAKIVIRGFGGAKKGITGAAP